MQQILSFGIILLLTSPLYAETYSWVDDSGTYNFTEDYSTVPKKYRKKVKRREETQQDEKPQSLPITTSIPTSAVKESAQPAAAVSAAGSGGDKELYGGKSRAEWRNALDAREIELAGIEQRMVQLRSQIYNVKGGGGAEFDVLKKEYDEHRVTYDQKYKSYTELIETVRKAGIIVEIKK